MKEESNKAKSETLAVARFLRKRGMLIG